VKELLRVVLPAAAEPGVQGLRFRVQGLGVQGLGIRSLGFGVWEFRA